MSKELIYDSPSATLWFHPEKKILHHKIHRYMPEEEEKEFLLLGTKTLQERDAQKWLSEDQTSSAMNKDFFEWGTTEWFPKTIAAGWKYWAIIQPNHIISQIEHEKMAKDYGAMGIEARFFDAVEEALEWLESI